MALTDALYGGILVGGRSRRMGTAKALLVHQGRTFFARLADPLGPCVERLFVLGGGAAPRRHTANDRSAGRRPRSSRRRASCRVDRRRLRSAVARRAGRTLAGRAAQRGVLGGAAPSSRRRRRAARRDLRERSPAGA